VFRKAPFVKIPESQDGIGKAMARFSNDADMLGTSLFGYAKNVVREVISVGRSGTLVDWEGDYERRTYALAYRAEDILNWRVGRVYGHNVPTMIVLVALGGCFVRGLRSRYAAASAIKLRPTPIVHERRVRARGLQHE